jgi:cytochrome P450
MDAIDLRTPQFKADPYPTYERLRTEAPVATVRIGRQQFAWLITRYEDVAAALKDERFAKDRRNARTNGRTTSEPWVPRVFSPLMNNMLDLDEPAHARLRGLVQRAFTAGFVENLRSRIEALTEQLLDRVDGQHGMDVIADYALPVPTTIIAEMLGVPVSDRKKFHRWSAAVVSLSPTGGVEMLKAVPSVLAFLRYIRKLVRLRRAELQDDLISALIRAEEAGEKLSEDELLAMIFLLLVAGHETTVNLIGNGTLALLENPGEMEKLRTQPSLMSSAVEELLRYYSPVELATERWARCDVTMAGVTIPPGALAFAGIAAANRDPRQFDRPDILNIEREPNRHLAFGQGAHYCVGAPLARLEAQIAFTTLLRRFPGLRLGAPSSAIRWRKSLVLRGLQALPVEFA